MFLRKLKIEVQIDLGIPLLGVYRKNIISQIQKDICTPIFVSALFAIVNIWKHPKCPSVDESIKKVWYIDTMCQSPAPAGRCEAQKDEMGSVHGETGHRVRWRWSLKKVLMTTTILHKDMIIFYCSVD